MKKRGEASVSPIVLLTIIIITMSIVGLGYYFWYSKESKALSSSLPINGGGSGSNFKPVEVVRWNSETNALENYNGDIWFPVDWNKPLELGNKIFNPGILLESFRKQFYSWEGERGDYYSKFYVPKNLRKSIFSFEGSLNRPGNSFDYARVSGFSEKGSVMFFYGVEGEYLLGANGGRYQKEYSLVSDRTTKDQRPVGSVNYDENTKKFTINMDSYTKQSELFKSCDEGTKKIIEELHGKTFDESNLRNYILDGGKYRLQYKGRLGERDVYRLYMPLAIEPHESTDIPTSLFFAIGVKRDNSGNFVSGGFGLIHYNDAYSAIDESDERKNNVFSAVQNWRDSVYNIPQEFSYNNKNGNQETMKICLKKYGVYVRADFSKAASGDKCE